LRHGRASYGFAYRELPPAGPGLRLSIDTSGLDDSCKLYSSKPPALERFWYFRADLGAAAAGEYDAAKSEFDLDGGQVDAFEVVRSSWNYRMHATAGTVTLDDDATERGGPLSMHIAVELEPKDVPDEPAAQTMSYTLDLVAHYCPSLCTYAPSENEERCSPD
jgi:hypothetical protein